jgi:hypothetical protein
MRRPVVPLRYATLVAALVGTAAVTGGLLAGPAPAALAADAADVGSTVQITVTSLTPTAAQPGDDVVVSGTVANRGTQSLEQPTIQLRVSTQPVASRRDLAAQASSTDRPPGDALPEVVQPGASLDPGVSVAFTLTARSAELNLADPGVYPLAVEVIAGPNGSRTRYGTQRFYLPYDMAGVRPTRVATLWPVTATPSRGADGTPITTSSGLTVIHQEVTGRLGSLVAAGAGLPVTWVVDGDTAESAAQVAAGSSAAASTASGTPSATTEPPDPVVAAWLDQLAEQAAATQALSLAYADPDLVAVTRAGLSGDVVRAQQLATAAVQQALGRGTTVTQGPAWPADGTADGDTLSAVRASGATQIVLSSAYTDSSRPVAWTPSALGPLEGTGLTAVVADAPLSALLTTRPGLQGGPVLARQRMLAELAEIGLELPTVARSVVVVADRQWTPDVAYVQSLYASLAQTPWVQLTTLAGLQGDAAGGPARQQPRYPAGLRGRELSGPQIAAAVVGHEDLDAVAAVLTQPEPTVGLGHRALLRAESTAWRVRPADGAAYAGSIAARIRAVKDQVRVVAAGAVTLAARSGKIPVTVTNALDQPVTVRVGVDVVPAARLTVTAPPTVTVPARGSTTLDLAAEATANGSAQLTVRLQTPDGAAYGPPHMVTVQITGLGAVAQLLVAVALVLLTVAVIVRVVRAVRSGRRRLGSPASVRERVR